MAEQVSHHPPVTAVYIWDDEHGIRGEGYSRVEMTFSGSVDIRQTGHAMLHIGRYDEDHLISTQQQTLAKLLRIPRVGNVPLLLR